MLVETTESDCDDLTTQRGLQRIQETKGIAKIESTRRLQVKRFRSEKKNNKKGKTPEIGIPPSDRATRRYTKVHLDVCLRFSTLIGQTGRVPLFGAGPRRYISSRLFRLAVTVFWRTLTASWRTLTASWRQKGKRKQVFLRDIRTTELPSNPSPLTFRNNQIQILQTSSTHATMAANVSQQDTNTHGAWLSHARTHTQRETKGQKPSQSRDALAYGQTHTRSRGWQHPS